jgi:hypothetical protein
MSDSRVFAKSGDLVARVVGDETVLVPVRYNVGNLDAVYTLTPVAARVWEIIDGKATVAEIVGRLCVEYDVTGEIAGRDVSELLATLEGASLIRLERNAT